MNAFTIFAIILGSVIAGFIVCFGLYAMIKSIFLNRYSKYLTDLETLLSHEPYIDTLTALRTVDITLKEQEKRLIEKMTAASNDEIKENDVKIAEINAYKEKFAMQFIDIEERIKKINVLKDKLLSNLDKSIVFACSKIVYDVEQEKKQINEIRKEVANNTREFINPIRDFENKKYRFEKIVQSLENLVTKWDLEIQNDTFKRNIEEKMSKIQEYLGEASNHVSKGEQDLAFSSFTMFKKTLFDLIVFANHYDKFREILFIKASGSFTKVYSYMEKVKAALGTDLDSLNINIFLENVNDELAKAKESFYNFNILETKENIEKYVNSLLGLTHAIMSEINAYNFFAKYGINEIQKYFKIVAKKFDEIKTSCDKILHIDKIVYWNLESDLNETKNILDEINKNISEYTNINSGESYYSKQSKYKKIFMLMNLFFEKCSEIEWTIDIFYTEGVSQGLKYNKLKMIFVNGLSDIKKFNIHLTEKDSKNISLIELKKQEIENYIINQETYNEKDLKEKVDVFFSLIIIFISETIKKTLILKSFLLINNEYSYKRLNDNFFDIKISECEDLLEGGKYDEGIKKLVETIRGFSN